jgi:hypothetical protein
MGGSESRGHPWPPNSQTVAAVSWPYATPLLSLVNNFATRPQGPACPCHEFDASTMHQSCRQQACLPSAEQSPDASTLHPTYTRQLRPMTLLTSSARKCISSELISTIFSSPPSLPLRFIQTDPRAARRRSARTYAALYEQPSYNRLPKN